MSQADWIKLIFGALLTTGLTLFGQVYVERRKLRFQDKLSRERAQWDELRERVTPLLKTAGALETHVGGYAIRQYAEEIRGLLHEFNTYPQQFADYPELRAAIWGFQNTVNIILDDQWFFLSDEQRKAHTERAAIEPPETSEERHQRQQQEREFREVKLPQTYQALVVAAKALLEPPSVRLAQASVWRRFFAWIIRVRRSSESATIT